MVIVESNNGLPVLILSNTIILKIFPDIVFNFKSRFSAPNISVIL